MQKTLIYIDVRSKSQVRATGSWATTADYPTLERGQWQVLCIQFVDRVVDTSGVVTLVPADMSLAASYLLVGDNNFEDEDGLMFKSIQSTVPFNSTDPETNRFNIDGDWVGGEFKDGDWAEGTATLADLAKGQMSIRINTDTEKFNSIFNGKERVQSGLYINIKQFLPGLENPCTIAWFKFIAVNTLKDYAGAMEEVPAGISVIPFIDSALRNPMEIQFAGDELDWHTGQLDSDTYWRFRLANTATIWSNPILLIEGPQGFPGIDGTDGPPGTPAGFGLPEATAVSVEPTEEANVTVGSYGPDTNKVFVFSFSIPKGEKGDRGAAFTIDATGTLAEREQYGSAPKDFSYLATDDGNVYIKQSESADDWSEGIPFKGDKGDPGEKGDPGTQGEKGEPGTNGADGYTPVRGTDYYTAEDEEELLNKLEDRLLNGEWGTE